MTNLGQFLTSELAASIGWTVIHSFWQATVLAFVYYLFTAYGRPHKAKIKYVLGYSLLMSQFFLSIVTFFWAYEPVFMVLDGSDTKPRLDVLDVLTPVGYTGNIIDYSQAQIADLLPLIVSVWLVGMLFFCVKLLIGYAFWHRLKTQNTVPLPEKWLMVFEKIKNKMSIQRSVEIACSTMVSSPVLIGHFKPIILLPIALVNQLSVEQLEVIIAHELAHSRRFDFVMNIFQLLVETLFYFHPAIWWLGQQIRATREESADEMALTYTNDSIVYARTLLRVAEKSREVQHQFAINFSGQKKQHLLTRVQRILQQPVKQPDMREKFVITSLLLCVAVIVSLGATWSASDSQWSIENRIGVAIDTLPQGKIKLEINDDGETLNVRLEDGEIEKLTINGNEVSSSEFSEYEERVAKLLENIPPPPPPPPPAPNTAPLPPGAIAPPPPPPAPHAVERHVIRKEIHKDIVDGEEIEVIIEEEINGKVKKIIIDGDEDIYVTFDDEESLMHIEERELIRVEEYAERQLERAERQLEMAERQLEKAEREIEREVKRTERIIHIEERMAERNEKEQERLEDLAEQHQVDRDEWLEQALLNDGLIDNKNNYSLKLNHKRMKINGKSVSKEVHHKYMNLFESRNGTDFSGNTSVNISKKMF